MIPSPSPKLLQMVRMLDIKRCASEEAIPRKGVDTRRCASKDVGPPRGVDLVGFPHRLEHGTSARDDAVP